MKHRFSLYILIFLLISLLFTCCMIRQEEGKSIDRLMISWQTASGTQKTHLFEDKGVYYGFLPAYADLSGLSIRSDAGCSVWLNDSPWENAHIEPDTKYTLTIKNAMGKEISEAPLIIMQSENIPSISIQLYNSSLSDLEQRKEETGHMTMINADSSIVHDGDFNKIRVIGNHTATLPKKPLIIKFSEDVDLLGTGGHTDYRLLANADDESRLRNKLVFETAQKFGLVHSPRSQFVDVYVDDAYYGLFLLTEKIAVDENRININPLYENTQAQNFFNLKHYEPWKSYDSGNMRKGLNIPTDPADITGGYLLEMEVEFRLGLDTNAFITNGGQIVSIKYPTECSPAQVNYIADYYQAAEDAVISGDFTDYIDLDSWARFYIIEEFFGQMDKTSVFFYKDSDAVDPKIYAGPVWDFDASFGLFEVVDENFISSPYQFYFKIWGMYKLLWEQDSFRSAVRQLYETEFIPIMDQFLPAAFDEYGQQIAAAHAMDKCRWYSAHTPPYGPLYGSLEGSLNAMESWLQERRDAFDTVILENGDFVQVALLLEKQGELYEIFPVVRGGYFWPLSSAPVREGYTFAGWFDENGVQLSRERIITDNTEFYAKWEKADETAPVVSPSAGLQEQESFFIVDSIIDLGVVLTIGGIGLYTLFHLLRDIFSGIRKRTNKRRSHED